MGLAASQARFLGITLRKANCEFKSTELAQQRLELTNQMTNISQEYANALNSTKLVWHNDMVTDSFGNPCDYGLSYSLLMMPSAANDYNPYMISTRSGAIVLNSKYAQAAKDAGISMAGGTPSADGRNKFLYSLSKSSINPSTGKTDDNVITETTYNILAHINTGGGAGIPALGDVSWHPAAGMGAAPKEKGVADVTTLSDLVADDKIGGRKLDWLQIYMAALGIENGTTEIEYDTNMDVYTDEIASAKLNFINAGIDGCDATYVNSVVDEARSEITITNQGIVATGIMKKFQDLEEKIKNSPNQSGSKQAQNELERLKNGLDADANLIDSDQKNTYKYPIYWAIYQEAKAKASNTNGQIKWNSDSGKSDVSSISVDKLFYTGSNGISDSIQTPFHNYHKDGMGVNMRELGVENPAIDYLNTLNLCVNDTFVRSESDIKGMTIADLLTKSVTLVAEQSDGYDPKPTIELAATAILESVARVFGYGNIGTGLNVDVESNDALNMAFEMTKKKFIKAGNAVDGSDASDDALLQNSAYVNAQDYNRMGTCDNDDYAAINLSNMLSAFLTYFDNYLRGADSDYVVGKGTKDDKTYFVTDDPSYVYVTNPEDGISNDEKIADFFNELYNNICEHGWRYDDMVQDSEYLESAIKDGRYQMMALNQDGYFYQMRYNEIGYMEEVQDTDAIARAESDFKTKKAQITFKEDQIDVKTKKLDAEIAELNTEMNSVQNIISKSIEKTFTMFSN